MGDDAVARRAARRDPDADRGGRDRRGRACGAGGLSDPSRARRDRPARRRRDAGRASRRRTRPRRWRRRLCAPVPADPRTQPDHQRQGRGYRIRLDARRMREHPHAIRFCRRQLEPGVRAQFGRRGLGQQLRPRPPHLPLRTLSAAAQRDDRSPRSAQQIHRARMRQRQCRRTAGRVAGRSAGPVAAAGQRAAGVRV